MRNGCCILLCLLLILPGGGTASSAETTLDRFCGALTTQQAQTGFLTRWQAEDQTALAALLRQYGLDTGGTDCAGRAPYPVPGTVILAAFTAVYGDIAFWPLSRQARFDELLTALSLQPETIHALPAAGELSPEEALAIAQDAVLQHAEAYRYDTGGLADYRVSLQYLRYDGGGGPLYLVHYYLPDRLWVVFDMVIRQSGACSFSYHDPLSMRSVYRDWYMARDFTRFIHWSLADKQAFWTLMTSLYTHETETSGGLPPIGETVLAHVHSVPTASEVQPDEALSIARQTLREQDMDPSAHTLTLSFYRDDPAAPRYAAAWVDADDRVQYTVIINALDGGTRIESPQP